MHSKVFKGAPARPKALQPQRRDSPRRRPPRPASSARPRWRRLRFRDRLRRRRGPAGTPESAPLAPRARARGTRLSST
eukprot:1598052-Pyramimonas_sp.AAC.1